jgi:ATP-dependent helicase/nuclease subunit B
MNAVIRNLSGKTGGRRVVPSAMLYYQVKDPVLDPEKVQSALADEDPERMIREKIHNELKPSGSVNADPDSYRRLDRDAGPGYRSNVIPLFVKRDGTFGPGSSVYTSEEFISLTEEVRETVCRLAEDILEGKAAAEPAVWSKDRSACDYCPYSSVCGFDPSIEGYRYRDR